MTAVAKRWHRCPVERWQMPCQPLAQYCNYGASHIGFKQHMDLGHHLSDAYGPLLTSLAERTGRARLHGDTQYNTIYARSTDYQRTFMSAAGLILH